MKLVAVSVSAIVDEGTRETYELYKKFDTLEAARSYVKLIQHHAERNPYLELCHVVVWGIYSFNVYGEWTMYCFDDEWQTHKSGWFFD